MKILIAEDDNVSRIILEKTLKKWGHDVIVTKDGEEAWDAFQKNDIRFAVLDWMMPGLDGAEVCRRIREADESNYTYVILLTAKDKISDIVAGLEAGADDYIIKPFDRSELHSRVKVGERIITLEEKLANTIVEITNVNELLINDLNAAAKIQKDLLPKDLPVDSNLKIAYEFMPCDQVGGDMINVFELSDNQTGLFISDVSGHGVPAAMFVVSLNQLLSPASKSSSLCRRTNPENGALEVISPEITMTRLNEYFQVAGGKTIYATMIYGVIDRLSMQFDFVSAGHPPIILVRDGEGSTVEAKGGLPVGIHADTKYELSTLQLKQNDRLYFYTDGVIEADRQTDIRETIKNLVNMLANCSELELSESLKKVNEMAIEKSADGILQDDVTVMAVEVTN